MSLILRVMRAVFLTALRAATLFFGLFVAYLALTEALPAYRSLAELAARRPALEQRVLEIQADLRRREWRTEQVRKQLQELVASELLGLRQNVESFEAALRDVDERRVKLEADLRDAIARETEYCTSWNPLKRWVCDEVRERSAGTRAAIEPLLAELSAAREGATQKLTEAGDALRRYELLPPELRGSTVDAQRLRAELGEQLAQQTVLRQTLTELGQELTRAKLAEASPWVWLSRQLALVGGKLALIVVLVMAAPWLQRVVLYFVVMPFVARARPLRLKLESTGRLEFGASTATLAVELAKGETCFARAGYVRPVTGKVRSQWLYDWRAPLVSYAAGLSVLTRIEGGSVVDGEQSHATLASPTHSDSYLLEVRLHQHPGFVFHPRLLVAVIGDVELWTEWRLFSVHSWLTGQVRYIGVKGTGRCVFEGFGDVLAQPVANAPTRIEQELVVGFDARLAYATARTETFLPYFLGRAPLVDDVFAGKGAYVWQKNTRQAPRSIAERWFEFFFGALGKLLGF